MQPFVKLEGHQDGHTSYINLTFEAQLNVQANQLAEDFNGQPNFQTQILMLPAYPAALEIKRIIITNNFQTQLQQAWTKPKYESYLEEKFEWTQATRLKIAWSTLSIALNSIQNDVVTFKICNDTLPTALHFLQGSTQMRDSINSGNLITGPH